MKEPMLVLLPGREKSLLRRHVWIFSGAVAALEGEAAPGETVVVTDSKRRFLARIDTPEKNWKFSAADIRERQYWDQYQAAYEKAINATATKDNPWYVIPADDKWYSRLIVSDILTKRIEKLPLAYPTLSPAEQAKLGAARQELLNEK